MRLQEAELLGQEIERAGYVVEVCPVWGEPGDVWQVDVSGADGSATATFYDRHFWDKGVLLALTTEHCPTCLKAPRTDGKHCCTLQEAYNSRCVQ